MRFWLVIGAYSECCIAVVPSLIELVMHIGSRLI